MVRAQRARQMAGQPTYGFFGDLFGGIGKVAKAIIPGGVDDILIDTVGSVFGGKRDVAAQSSCPPGFQANPTTGVCEQAGVTGAVRRFLPGGQTGTLPSVPPPVAAVNGTGQTTMGSFGMPAQLPYQAQSVALRCPTGFVLGKDNLCYPKGSIPMQFRKWRPGRKPPISAKDWRALQTADRVKNKAKGIASKAGFSCRRK